MSATSTSRGFAEHHDRAEADRTNPVVRRRRMTALVLTVFAIALGIGLVAAYGRDALVIYFSQLPLALALLWAATRDLRFDERDGEFSERP